MGNMVMSIVGAQPQFIKEAVVGAAARRLGAWRHVVVHSGQHYDVNMSDIFFTQLAMPKPDHFLGIGSGSHGRQTAEALVRVEELLLAERPDLVLVYGDTNTTVAGALAAAKLKIPVAHVEAGIRQEPKDMPEEINRVVTDHLAERLYCCSELARKNLEAIEVDVFLNASAAALPPGAFTPPHLVLSVRLRGASGLAATLTVGAETEPGGPRLATLRGRDFVFTLTPWTVAALTPPVNP